MSQTHSTHSNVLSSFSRPLTRYDEKCVVTGVSGAEKTLDQRSVVCYVKTPCKKTFLFTNRDRSLIVSAGINREKKKKNE